MTIQILPMNLALLLLIAILTAAFSYLLYLAITFLSHFLSQFINQADSIAKAQIIKITVKNEVGRRIPFVQMQVEVSGQQAFVGIVEGFYSKEELEYLHMGSVITVSYHSSAKTELKIIKEPTAGIYTEESASSLTILPQRKLSVAW